MKPNRALVDAALRHQIDVEDRSEERAQQQRAELYAREPGVRKFAEKMANAPKTAEVLDAERRFLEASERMQLKSQLEGFVAGWLVGSGQFDDFSELFGIWLETQRHTSLSDTEPPAIEDVSASLNIIAKRPAL